MGRKKAPRTWRNPAPGPVGDGARNILTLVGEVHGAPDGAASCEVIRIQFGWLRGGAEPVTNSGYGNELFSVQLTLDNFELLTLVSECPLLAKSGHSVTP